MSLRRTFPELVIFVFTLADRNENVKIAKHEINEDIIIHNYFSRTLKYIIMQTTIYRLTRVKLYIFRVIVLENSHCFYQH